MFEIYWRHTKYTWHLSLFLPWKENGQKVICKIHYRGFYAWDSLSLSLSLSFSLFLSVVFILSFPFNPTRSTILEWGKFYTKRITQINGVELSTGISYLKKLSRRVIQNIFIQTLMWLIVSYFIDDMKLPKILKLQNVLDNSTG